MDETAVSVLIFVGAIALFVLRYYHQVKTNLLEIAKDMKALGNKIRCVSTLNIYKILRYSALAYMCAAATHHILTVPPTGQTLINIMHHQALDYATSTLVFILLAIAMLVFAGTPYGRPSRSRRPGRKFAVVVLSVAAAFVPSLGVLLLSSGQHELATPVLVGGASLCVLMMLRMRWILAVPRAPSGKK